MSTVVQDAKRVLSLKALVVKKLGPEWAKPEVCYKFSNGRTFLSTDKSNSGPYSGS